jgi:trimeric autotransporter adhesin
MRFLVVAGLIMAASVGRAQVPTYEIYTVAGDNTVGYTGDGGSATAAELDNPCKVAVDGSGNLYIADQVNNVIREVSGGIINTIIGNGTEGYTGDAGTSTASTPTSAEIDSPCGIAVGLSGVPIYFSQTNAADSAVRSVIKGVINSVTEDPANSPTGTLYSGDGGPATAAVVSLPNGLALDSAGNIYITDTGDNRVRVVCTTVPSVGCPAGTTAGDIYTFAGLGVQPGQYGGDGGPAVRAYLNSPEGVAVDSSDNVYIADRLNNCIRVVKQGVIFTFAGICGTNGGFSGDGGPATKAQLNNPRDVAADVSGNIYIADSYNFRIRVVTPNGVITTIAGSNKTGYSGDGGLATKAELGFPQGVAVGPNGLIYIADAQNNVVRMLSPLGGPGQTVTSPPLISSLYSATACGGYQAQAAPGSWIEIYGSDLAADTRPWNSSDFQGNTAPTSLDGTSVMIAGQSAVLSYISPAQVNAQVPLAVGPGNQNVTVTAANGTSIAFTLAISSLQPGLCQGFTVAGNTYLDAFVGGTYILPASSPNVPSGVPYRPAHPGEILTFYGIGFGPVTPPATQGQLVQQINQIATTPFEIYFGGYPSSIPVTQATIQYAGLAPGFIGLYQFNVVVPNIPSSNAVPVTFAEGLVTGQQTTPLYTAISQP